MKFKRGKHESDDKIRLLCINLFNFTHYFRVETGDKFYGAVHARDYRNVHNQPI